MPTEPTPSPVPRLSLPMWTERYAAPFAPTTAAEIRDRGWDAVDVVFVTGDAYVDHPSFAMAILHRVLEQAGFRVAILSQPDWQSVRAVAAVRPAAAVLRGQRGEHGLAHQPLHREQEGPQRRRLLARRADRAAARTGRRWPYCQRCREAFPGVPVIAGGVEASLRRLAHYDYWSDTVRRSILLDARPTWSSTGWARRTIVEIAQRLAAGKTVKDLRDLRGVAYALGAKESDELKARSLQRPGFEHGRT